MSAVDPPRRAGAYSGERGQPGDQRFDRLCRVELDRAGGSEERLDLGEVGEDPLALLGALAERVARARGDPLEQHLRGRAQQHDLVEAVVEAALVRDRPRYEERRLALSPEQLVDPPLVPDVPAGLVRPRAPRLDVGLDGLEAAPRELGEHRRLAGAGHPSDEDPPHAQRPTRRSTFVSLGWRPPGPGDWRRTLPR